jgi:hypothetical protein
MPPASRAKPLAVAASVAGTPSVAVHGLARGWELPWRAARRLAVALDEHAAQDLA